MKEQTIKRTELIDVLRSMDREDELFYFFLRACENGNLTLCQICIDAGADINICESLYKEPLIKVLVSKGKFTTKVGDWLIEKGADINITGYGNSPFTTACYNGDYDLAKYFMDKGINICQYRKDGTESDLYNAVTGGNYDIVKMLLDKGVDTETDVRYELNPFINAVCRKRPDLIELFLKRNVSPNFYCFGKTPLHIAVEESDVESAQLLLKYKANVNARFQEFSMEYLALTPMDIAVFKKDTAMQKLLAEFGGAISSKEEKIKAISDGDNDKEIRSAIKKILAS